MRVSTIFQSAFDLLSCSTISFPLQQRSDEDDKKSEKDGNGRDGGVVEAICASCSFPLLFQPVEMDLSSKSEIIESKEEEISSDRFEEKKKKGWLIDGGVFDHSGAMSLPFIPHSNITNKKKKDDLNIVVNLICGRDNLTSSTIPPHFPSTSLNSSTTILITLILDQVPQVSPFFDMSEKGRVALESGQLIAKNMIHSFLTPHFTSSSSNNNMNNESNHWYMIMTPQSPIYQSESNNDKKQKRNKKKRIHEIEKDQNMKLKKQQRIN